VEHKDWTLPMEQMENRWQGRVRSNPAKVTVADAPEGPAKVELAPKPGEPVDGLKMTICSPPEASGLKAPPPIRLTCRRA
jgi:hypothetical protein